MREILLTSSVLILALLALRRVFRQKISRRLQYALWGLVLVRLLVPVSLPAVNFSVLTVAEPVRSSISTRLEAPAFTAPVAPALNPQPQQSRYPAAVEPAVPGADPVPQPSAPVDNTNAAPAAKELSLTEVLRAIWLAGTAGMAVWLLASNLHFAMMLRDRRISVKIPGCKRRTYIVESGLASPCLFGILRPAVYLTPSAAGSEESLRHVLAHEETHARHLDPLWALLRSICLAVYWFDPLVWIAASAAKTDCELACDEGAIRTLGEEERLAYGKTLLRLIPVRRLPGNPLLSATTMSSDKKRLRDRISRIAEKRETRKLALCAVALLTAVTCLVTFAGRAESQDAGTKGKPAARQDGPMTAAELRYFNEQFFNGGYDYVNINNQFLSSIYEEAADIDIFQLAYCEVPVEYYRDSGMPQEDREIILRQVYGGEEPECPDYSINTATLDALLTDKMGLTLAETKKIGMEGFTYLPEYDTYYWAHGDTNYRPNVYFFAGVREGKLLHLYYDETAGDSICTCVTLRETGGGEYQFVSNTYSEKPIIPTVYPEGEPLAVIPLTDLTPYEPEQVEVTRHSGDCQEWFIYQGNWVLSSGEHIQSYRSTDGNIYIAQIIDEAEGGWEADCFAVMPDENFSIEPFAGLFEQGGFAVCRYSEAAGVDLTDYYCFKADGSLWHLAQVPGGIENARIMDMNGDGTNELLAVDGFSGAGLVFQRDGKLCNADVAALLAQALPGETLNYFCDFDPYARCFTAYTFAQKERENGAQFEAMLTRCIYFDGENLLVYRQDKSAVDHIVQGVIAPEDVLDNVRNGVLGQYNSYTRTSQDRAGAQVDDWRVAGLEGPYYEQFDNLNIKLYRFAYEFHAAAPQNVVMTDDLYLDENGWFGVGYSGYACFVLGEDGSWTPSVVLYNSDGPGTNPFREHLEEALITAALLEPTPAWEVENHLGWIMKGDEVVLELRGPVKDNGWIRANSFKRYTVSPNEGNARNRQQWFTDPDTFSWSEAGELPPAGDPAPNAEELTIASPNGDFSMTFFSNSELVLCEDGDSVRWFRAKNLTDPADPLYDRSDIFNFMRQWFDEIEYTQDAVVIPDDGRSREEIALAWARAYYESRMLDITETNRYHCSYVDVRDVEIDTDYPRELYPGNLNGREAFLIWYSVVFVPDDWRYHMAGNTAEYEGGDAPEGAFQCWRIAYLYLDGDGWRCDSVGTGP